MLVKKYSFGLEDQEFTILGMHINSDNYNYSLYDYHSDMTLNLIQANIEFILCENKKSIFFKEITGILFLTKNEVKLIFL